MARDLVLTGVPRSGTTLCCRLLNQAPETVALVEPMPVQTLPVQPAQAVAEIAAFFAQSRQRLLAEGRATSQQIAGQGTDNFFDADRRDGLRVRKAQLGEVQVGKPLSPQFTLAIKHNAAFTALLPALLPVFDCVAVVRNPLAVLASWSTVDLPVRQGRLPAGERFDPELTARLDAQPDVLERQCLLLDWLFSRFASVLPAARIVRYEDVVASQGQALTAATGVALPALPLQSRNASALYAADDARRFAQRLQQDDGAWRAFYSDAEMTQALAALLERV